MAGHDRHKARREHLKEAGLCINCGREKAHRGLVRCKACDIKNKESNKKLRKEREKRMECMRCGRIKDDPDKTMCTSCMMEDTEYKSLSRGL